VTRNVTTVRLTRLNAFSRPNLEPTSQAEPNAPTNDKEMTGHAPEPPMLHGIICAHHIQRYENGKNSDHFDYCSSNTSSGNTRRSRVNNGPIF
jgi:hypothetical protein